MKTIFLIYSRFPLPKTGGQKKILLEYVDYLKGEPVRVLLYAFDKRRKLKSPSMILNSKTLI